MKKQKTHSKNMWHYLTVLLMLIAVSAIFGQTETTVSGAVYDETGIPLPGANVIIEGTSTGTTTDFDGNFNLSVQ